MSKGKKTPSAILQYTGIDPRGLQLQYTVSWHSIDFLQVILIIILLYCFLSGAIGTPKLQVLCGFAPQGGMRSLICTIRRWTILYCTVKPAETCAEVQKTTGDSLLNKNECSSQILFHTFQGTSIVNHILSLKLKNYKFVNLRILRVQQE